MRKPIAFLLVVAVLLSLTACGGTDSGSTGAAETQAAETQASEAEENTITVTEETTELEPVVAAVAETMLAETDSYRITASELTFDESGLPTLRLLVENLSSESLSFNLETLAVNQYMLPESFVSTRAASVADYVPEHEADPADLTVEAGAQETWALTVDSTDWALLGITDIGEFSMRFAVTSSNGSEVTEKVVLPTTLADSYGTSDSYLTTIAGGSALGGSVLFSEENAYYDNGGIRIISAAVVDTGSDSVLLLEAVNDSESDATLSFGKACVNGYQISDEIWSAPIDAGKTMVLSYNYNTSGAASETYRNAGYYTTVLADCGVTTFCSLSMAVSASDESGTAIAEEGQVTVTLSDEAVPEAPSGSSIYSGNGIKVQFLGRSSGPSGYFYDLVLVENANSSAVMVDGGAAYEIDGVAVGCLNLAAGQSGIMGFVFPSSGPISSITGLQYTIYLTGGVNTQGNVSSH